MREPAAQLSGDGRWLFVVNAGSNTLSTFAVRLMGPVLKSGGRLWWPAPHQRQRARRLVDVLNGGGSGNVAAFRNVHSTLVPVNGSVHPLSAAGGTGPAQVSIGPDGDIAIAEHGRTLSILAPRAPAIFTFTIANDGALTPAAMVAGLPAGVVGIAAN